MGHIFFSSSFFEGLKRKREETAEGEVESKDE